MPHLRRRAVLPKLLKKLKFFPIVAIQGARQTGKSVLAKNLLLEQLPEVHYQSFDDLGTRREAETSPRTFLLRRQKKLLIIDEAQKVPEIFDALKFQVDQNRIPGTYLILGSTEFSRLSQIRESLTGRMGRIRLFPMTLAETLNHSTKDHPTFQQSDVIKYLESGGMPGIFSVRDEEVQTSLFQDGLDLVCLRDIHQFKNLKLDGDVAFEVLRATAQLEEPTQAGIAKKLKMDGRKIATYLKALVELFVLYKLDSHPSGTGRSIFLPFDTGVAKFLGASLMRRLHIWILNERMAYNSYFEMKRSRFTYYRSRAKTMIHLIEDAPDRGMVAYQCFEKEVIKKIDAELLRSFLVKNPKAKIRALAPLLSAQQVNGIEFFPWELG